MEIGFCFEVVGDFRSENLWKELQFTKVNLLDAINHVYVYGAVAPLVLTRILVTCRRYGVIKGGEFACE